MRTILAIQDLEGDQIVRESNSGMKYNLIEDRSSMLVNAAFPDAKSLLMYVKEKLTEGYSISQDARDYLDGLVVHVASIGNPHATLCGAVRDNTAIHELDIFSTPNVCSTCVRAHEAKEQRIKRHEAEREINYFSRRLNDQLGF